MEAIKNWLSGYPGMGQVLLDAAPAEPGGCGLYPRGVTELWRREDLLGNVTVRCRETFSLVRVCTDTPEQNALWMQVLAAWVRQQCAQALAPVLGEACWLQFSEGRREKDAHPGVCRYTAKLTVEYSKTL